jgi:hypothetical protein
VKSGGPSIGNDRSARSDITSETNPAVHFGITAGGQHAWYGWPDVPQLDNLVTDWVRAIDQTGRKRLARRNPKGGSRRSDARAMGEWFSADRVPKERP